MLAASIFHRRIHSIGDVKAAMAAAGLPVRVARRPPRDLALDPSAVRFAPADGLVPGIVQDVADGRVLMVAWMDAEALAATLETGEVHFHSRSRDRLWRKGETSGNVLVLREISVDCDGDALLLRSNHAARPAIGAPGAASTPRRPAPASAPRRRWPRRASTGSRPCGPRSRSRVRPDPPAPTRRGLLDGGVDAVARKVTEEATEVLLRGQDDAAAEDGGRDRGATQAALAGEAGDLLYHALVLLAERGLQPSAVIDVLRGRHSA